MVTALDEVAWLLNLRGSDVDYNPVFLSYVLLTSRSATLVCDCFIGVLCMHFPNVFGLMFLNIVVAAVCRQFKAR